VAPTLFVSFIGWSRTGKTTFIVAALEECRRRGIAVSAVKRARHEADLAPEGKDSTLFLAAGARISVYIGDNTSVEFRRTPIEQGIDFYSSFLSGEAFVFLEGPRFDGALTVLVAGAAKKPSDLKLPLSDCDILIADDPPAFETADGGPRVFRPDAIGDFMDYLVEMRGT
jgi:molybdopterin-guanine dinucleotide biosynthesis protein